MTQLAMIIRRGHVVRHRAVERLDLGIAPDGNIALIQPDIADRADSEIDASGLHVFPGVIDAHVHFNEPGRADWEGVATGSSAFAAGGGTLYFDMPLNSSPPVLDGEQFDKKLAACCASSVTDFALWGGLTPNNLDKLDELADRGVVGFKAFMCDSGIDEFGAADDWTLYRGMRSVAARGLVVAVHAESDPLAQGFTDQVRRAGGATIRDYLDSRPPVVETEAIGRAIELAHHTKCKLHIVHVSSWQGVRIVQSAREAGLDVTCETCPHYLLLNDQDVVRIGANAKCAPPIRDEDNRERMVELVKGGQIDLVASDHSPSPASMKQNPDAFVNWGGIAGVQSTLPALLTLDDDVSQVAELLGGSVARRFGISGKGRIEVGNDADLCLVDLDGRFTLNRDMLLDRHKLSPFIGREFRGIVRRTLIRGKTAYKDGKIEPTTRGQFVRPNVND